MLLGLGAPLGVARQSVVDLGQSLLEHRAALGELRGAHVELATLAGHGGGAFVELELHQRARLEERLRLGGVGLEHGHPHLERGDALDVGFALRLQRLLLGRDRGELHLALRALGLHAARAALGARRARGPHAARRRRRRLRRVDERRARRWRRRASRARPCGLRRLPRPRVRASSSAARVAASASPPRRHEPRPPKRSPRLGDDGERRLAQHEVERARPVAVGEDRTVEQPLDRGGEAGDGAAHAVGEGPGPGTLGAGGRGPATPDASATTSSAPESPSASRASGLAGGDRTVDHDGRAPRRRATACTAASSAGVDVEVVDERTDHAGHVVERRRGRRRRDWRRARPRASRPAPASGRRRRRRSRSASSAARRASVARATACRAASVAARSAGSDSVMRACVAVQLVVLGRERADARAALLEPRGRARELGVDAGERFATRSRGRDRAMRRSSALRSGCALSANARCAAARSYSARSMAARSSCSPDPSAPSSSS